MASISTNTNGQRRVFFKGPDGRRMIIWLGKVSLRHAERLRVLVEDLNQSKKSGTPPDEATLCKLNGFHESVRAKLLKTGLIESSASTAPTALEPFVRAFVDSRTTVKPATKEIWRQGEMSLLAFFGSDRPLHSVAPGDADEFLEYLKGSTSRLNKPLAPMTIQKRLRFAKMIFRAAYRKKLIAENPFEDVSFSATMLQKGFFVTPEITARILAACPDHTWRLIVVLCRYAGLRCPSEVLSLKWTDILWDEGRMVVHSPKTEHHPGKESRIVPLFPELADQLRESFELAHTGTVYVVESRYRERAISTSGWRNTNLRTQFQRIIKRAGLTPWPRLFHNLRSSRQTELAEAFPSHVVCTWLGNSEDIARKHYLQVTEAHFTAAVGRPKPDDSPTRKMPSATPQKVDAHFDARAAQIGSEQPNAIGEKDPRRLTASLTEAMGYPTIQSRNVATTKTPKRTGWDSNPRAAFTTAGFQDRCIRPLCHPSR